MNKSDILVKLPGSTFLGQGGNGEFVDLSVAPERDAEGLWSFNRLCEFKRDGKERGSGGIVLEESETSSVDASSVVISTLEQASQAVNESVEFTVYAHRITRATNKIVVMPATNPIGWIPQPPTDADVFSESSLGQWLKPAVNKCADVISSAAQIPIFRGVVRSAFSMHLKGLSLEPVAKNPLCIFTSKQIAIRPKEYYLLQ